MNLKHLTAVSAVTVLLLGGCATGTAAPAGTAAPEAAHPETAAALSPLPKPEITEGLRGEQFGIDKNIDETTIDQYLGREDTVYRDMRMLVDEANYEAIGGDRWLSGVVEGFEVVPYPYLCNVEGLPEEVGSSYQGETLFTKSETGYTANYEQSMAVLEYLFPKDKNIILMCGGGGYAGMTKAMLAALGWDADRIWNAGGFWYYEGDHALNLKREENGQVYYDFYKVNYHYLDFATMAKLDGSAPSQPQESTAASFEPGYPALTTASLKDLIEKKETFAVSVYLPSCSTCVEVAPVIQEVADSGQIPFYQMSMSDMKKEDNVISEKVTYTPSVVIFKEGKLAGYLDAGKDEDLEAYKSAKALSEWISQFVKIDIVTGSAEVDVEECGKACEAFPQFSVNGGSAN